MVRNPVAAILILVLLFVGGFSMATQLLAKTEVSASQVIPVTSWPRQYESNGNQVVIFQPQLDEWTDYGVLKAKSAVAVKLKGSDQDVYGSLYMETDTETDHSSRTVQLKNIHIVKLAFPNVDKTLAKKSKSVVESVLPAKKSLEISLDRIIAGLERTQRQSKQVNINFEPPPIYTSYQSAILIIFMGEPQYKAVDGAPDLLYAINTNWDILLESGTSRYYLLNGDSWLSTQNLLKGPWQTAKSLPASFDKLPADDNWKAVKQHIPGKLVKTVPKVFTSLKPAELIVIEGQPVYSPIPGTKLLYASNTDSDLFLHSADNSFYFLTAGRWFKAKKLNGPWSSASTNLPEDFQNIPDDHARARVLSAVPGTSAAEAAVILASVPKKATVNREETTLKVTYEGSPQFVKIDGTEGGVVYYAVNTPFNIFKAGDKFYGVHDGVWFEADSPAGPWVVSVKVPDVIYTIPSTHPKHNVTYVYIYESTPDTVVVGYTSGYSGSYVAATGVVMFGLGYWLAHDDDWHHYHHHPHYYGYGGAARYDYYYGGYYQAARVYGPYGGAAGVSGYNPNTGRYYRGGYANGPYGSAFAREAYNPATNRYAGQVGAKTPYGSWGRSVVSDGDNWARAGHRSEKGRTVAGFETSKGAAGVGGYNKYTGQKGFVGKDKYGDVYVGRDGEIYKRGDQGWEQRTREGWNRTTDAATRDTSTRRQASQQTYDTSKRRSVDSSRQSASNRLNRDYQSRQTGNRRASSFQRQRSSGGTQRSRGGSRGRSRR